MLFQALLKIAIPSLRVTPFLTHLVFSAKNNPNRFFGLGYSFVVEKIVARFELGATAKPKKRLSIVFSDDRRFFVSKSRRSEKCEQKSKRKISSSPPTKRTPNFRCPFCLQSRQVFTRAVCSKQPE